MSLNGKGPVQPGGQLLVPRGQLTDSRGNLLQLVAGRFAFPAGEHAGNFADRLGVAPGHPQRQENAQADKNRQNGQVA